MSFEQLWLWINEEKEAETLDELILQQEEASIFASVVRLLLKRLEESIKTSKDAYIKQHLSR